MNAELISASPAPVAQADRIKTIDMIRGFALLGILLMNIAGFGMNWGSMFPVLDGPHNTKDFYALAAINSFFNGTMRGLFSMVFGAGVILFTINKRELPDGRSVAEYYYRRLLWLILFGLFNAFILLWWGDILFYYGLFGMLLFVFRKTNPKWLLVLGLVCMAIAMLKGQLDWNEFRGIRKAYNEVVFATNENKKLTSEQESAKAEWLAIEKNRVPDSTYTNPNVRIMQSGYSTIFKDMIPRNTNNEIMGAYHWEIWDCLSMMLIGMALFGWGFFSNKLSTSTYAMWLLIGYGIGIPIGWLAFKEGMLSQFTGLGNYVDSHRVSHGLLYDVRRILLSIGHASLLLLIYRSRIMPWLMKALANVGQMALTNYLMQSIICTLFFFGYGLGNYNKLKFHELYYFVFAVWILQLIYSSIWMRYFRFGPFEWVWRSLTYWKRQPMKK